jgi:hypothetical protein
MALAGMLDEGIYTSVTEIGDTENVAKSYVSRILRLALLAPDIVEAEMFLLLLFLKYCSMPTKRTS